MSKFSLSIFKIWLCSQNYSKSADTTGFDGTRCVIIECPIAIETLSGK